MKTTRRNFFKLAGAALIAALAPKREVEAIESVTTMANSGGETWVVCEDEINLFDHHMETSWDDEDMVEMAQYKIKLQPTSVEEDDYTPWDFDSLDLVPMWAMDWYDEHDRWPQTRDEYRLAFLNFVLKRDGE